MKYIVLFAIVMFIGLSLVTGQGLQSLSYPEGVAVNPRPPSTTPPTVATESTTRRGFFGGIKNFFGGGKSTTPIPSSEPTTAVPTIATRPTTSRAQPTQPQARPSQPPINVNGATISSTTRRPSTPKEEFPALPGQRNSNNNQLPASTTSVPAWHRPPTPPTDGGSVRFVPPPQPPSMFTTKATTTRPATAGTLEFEVKELSELLFTKDTSNLNRFVTPNYQKNTVSYSLKDDAPDKFLSVDEQRLHQVTTVEKMRSLFNNYLMDTSENEHSTALEKNEENDFIEELLKTNVMRTLMQFLQTKLDIVTSDPKTHKELLKLIWFTMYSRGQGKIGSSGFEHVFLAENKNNTIIGLHNWIYMYEMEKAGHLDYKGWIRKVDLGSSRGAVAKVRFTFDNLNKPVNGVFIGTSPELEIGLYTLCFATFPDKECLVASNGQEFKIRTYTYRYRGKTVIGSAYPEVI